MIDDAAGLVAVAQIGGLEIHLWGSRAKTLEKPDRLVFDLDPDPSVGFADVREGEAEQTIVPTGHLTPDPFADGFGGRVPLEIECLLRGLAVAGHRHHVGHADGVVPWVAEPADLGIGEVLDHRERRQARRDLGQRDRRAAHD